MSRTKMMPLVAAVILFAGMGTAHAEIRPGAVTFSPLVGGYLFEGDQDLEHNLMVGGALGYDFTKHFGVEGMFNYIPTEHIQSDINVENYVYHLDGLFYFRPDSTLVPYFALGGGGISPNPDGAAGDTHGLVDYGLGLKYFMTDNLAFRADVRHLISFGDIYNNLSYAVGLTYQWGGAKPAPPAPAVAAPAPAPPPKPEAKKEVCVYLDVFFDFDRAEVKPRHADDLKKVADFMKQNPDLKATIKGYTDYVGTEEYNQKLSERRAEAVKNYLVSNYGIDPGRISTVGYGKTHPLATNETAFGRQLNRRASEVMCTFQVVFQ
ncbi:MAG: OmpA family protein [Desulfobacteraceae bacterium]|nr:OmpA family protein [Desulfobacteraceae bacterium]